MSRRGFLRRLPSIFVKIVSQNIAWASSWPLIFILGSGTKVIFSTGLMNIVRVWNMLWLALFLIVNCQGRSNRVTCQGKANNIRFCGEEGPAAESIDSSRKQSSFVLIHQESIRRFFTTFGPPDDIEQFSSPVEQFSSHPDNK